MDKFMLIISLIILLAIYLSLWCIPRKDTKESEDININEAIKSYEDYKKNEEDEFKKRKNYKPKYWTGFKF